MTLYAQWSEPHQTTLDFAFTGMPQFVGIARNGYSFRLECWGSGSTGGSRGSYTSGEISLNWRDMLYPFVGGKDAWNGGGLGINDIGGRNPPRDGSGSTDFRLVGSAWNADAGLQSRIMVAAGAGANGSNQSPGGGLVAYSTFPHYQKPATQIKGGYMTPTMWYSFPHAGYFGYGSDSANGDIVTNSGGGGWYGGSGGNNGGEFGSTGGSSFISGMNGCNAIALPVTRIPATGDEVYASFGGWNVGGWRYQERTTGDISVMTIGGKDYIFSNASMVDGQGYQWNTGMKATSTTGMPDYTKTDDLPYMTGNTGDGYARITILPQK
jgi:hypothetical protein